MDVDKKQAEVSGEMTKRFDLMAFTDDLITDLHDLRANRISVKEAQARALLAKHVLRSVQLVIEARKFLEGSAKVIPPAKEK